MNNLEFLSKYKLFIVDYDGTLLDSMKMWNHLLSNFLNDSAIEFNEDIDDIAKEKTNVEAVIYMHDNYFNHLSYKELEDLMYEYVKKQYVMQKLKPGAITLIKELKKYGRVVLFSATANELLNDSFKTNNIDKYFDYIYSASNMGISKSGGTGFNKILEIESIEKGETLIVEDVMHAIEGAKNQGFDTLAVFDNQRHWNEIKNISNYNIDLNNLKSE